jgi:pimeloyl-ACP methyl ester carboxylesterase
VTTFVLVHGAWTGGWGYKKTARLLRAGGHEVYVVTLTGLGERSHLSHPGITLSTHIQDVVNVFEYEDITDAVLVGHSYGGMVITGVSGRVADRIRSLVYLDAFLPANGQALWDIAGEQGRQFYIDGQKSTPGLVGPMGLAATLDDPGLAELRRKKLDLHPLLTLTEPVRLDGSERTIAKRTYILATKQPAFQRFYDQVKNDPAWTTKTIDTGHVVMMEDPEGLAKLLMEEA